MKRLYARLYFAMLAWSERRAPGDRNSALPNRVVVSRLSLGDSVSAADGSWTLSKNGAISVRACAASPSENRSGPPKGL
jgi:hypothetical protein